MDWSVRQLLNFSYIPGINEAYEGNWTGDGREGLGQDVLDVSLGLEWLDDSQNDENNNGTNGLVT